MNIEQKNIKRFEVINFNNVFSLSSCSRLLCIKEDNGFGYKKESRIRVGNIYQLRTVLVYNIFDDGVKLLLHEFDSCFDYKSFIFLCDSAFYIYLTTYNNWVKQDSDLLMPQIIPNGYGILSDNEYDEDGYKIVCNILKK